MNGGLPISLRDLIYAGTVEDNRREFKASWNESTRDAVVRTVCAFANDLLNLNGGYVVIGVETDEAGQPILPPRGIQESDLDRMQREIRGRCNRIDPFYQPLLFPEEYEGRSVMVVWAPGGDTRPYQAPSRGGGHGYFVRQGSETVEATGDLRTQLFGQAARVPFDDRRNLSVGADRISERLVKEFLADVGSQVGRDVPFDRERVFANMRLTYPLNAHMGARNFALLFFVDDPDEIFPGARIDVVQFADDAGGSLIEERIIRGPLHYQVRQTLRYLESLEDALLEKTDRQPEVSKTVTYPREAVREAVVNAVYHRSYEESEPTKIYMYPDRMEITSYPGPVHGLELHHLDSGVAIPPIPARNRKIGELLKELHLAEARGTGLPRMRHWMSENGSSEPRFDFDDGRTYFRVLLPAHPHYRTLHALREAALMWATGNRRRALAHLVRATQEQPGSGALAGQTIEYATSLGDTNTATETFRRFEAASDKTQAYQPYLRYAAAMLDAGRKWDARDALASVPSNIGQDDLLEAAILNKRLGNYTEAHRLFHESYQHMSNDPRVTHGFAQSKIALARRMRPEDFGKNLLLSQAVTLLRRAIQLPDDEARKAWCWFDLAETLASLGESYDDVADAYRVAMALKPEEQRFRDAYTQWLG